MDKQPQVNSGTINYKGKFVMFKTLNWTDAHGIEREWEAANRVSNHGAVLILAKLMPSDRIVLIRQYRPPAEKVVFEFPAGLIDKGETPEQAATRELREETGYIPSSLTIHPAAYTTPGLSDEYVCMVTAEIDETRPENKNPKTDFDPSESIETLLLERKELFAFYRRESEAGHAFDAKLAAFILALAEF